MATGALDEARAVPERVQSSKEAVLHLGTENPAGGREVEHHEQRHHPERGPTLEERVQTGADQQNARGVQPGHTPHPPQSVIDEVEDGPRERRPDGTDHERRTDGQRCPQPQRQYGPGTADHRDRSVRADADRDQQKEDALPRRVVVSGRRHVRDLERKAVLRRDRGEDLLHHGRAGVGTRSRHQQLGPRRPHITGPATRLATRYTAGRAAARRAPGIPRRLDHIRTEDVLMLELVDRGGPVADRPYLQIAARLVIDRLRQQLHTLARPDDRDGQMMRRRIGERAQVRQTHADAHQQRGDQVRQDVPQPGGMAGAMAVLAVLAVRRSALPGSPRRWSGRGTGLMMQAFSAGRLG